MTEQVDAVRDAALKLQELLCRRDASGPTLREGMETLVPVIRVALNGGFLPSELPRSSYFFGMHDWEFGSVYFGDTELMNAIGFFADALKSRPR